MFKKTKEKINQNEYVAFIKKMWANKRYRALLVLILYFIFFFVIIMGLRSTYQNNNENTNYFSFDSLKTEYNNLRDYQYEIFVNEELLIDGQLENGMNNFEYDKAQYTFINNSLYKMDNDDFIKVDLEKEEILLTIIDKLMLDKIINYVSTINSSGVINSDSFSLDFEVPNSYFGLEGEELVKVNISGETITKVDKIIVDLRDLKEELYNIKIIVGDKNE